LELEIWYSLGPIYEKHACAECIENALDRLQERVAHTRRKQKIHINICPEIFEMWCGRRSGGPIVREMNKKYRRKKRSDGRRRRRRKQLLDDFKKTREY
jgi:hypothetical protein